ncbi:L-type lectin-domain containing receptor kinase IX.1-like [Senna tora]|uniref:non-specific serine/threonine protein kinase n=1 Tax=Senna tora TaxID=362788 RepID=A0A835CL44_9FABA|nr:L-type lectin-domain containing receptor kinase IX.1-like [Senna tora]
MVAWNAGFLFFILMSYPSGTAIANPLSFDYSVFKEGDLKLQGDASVLSSAIEVTAISASDRKAENGSNYSVGRVTSIQQMKLWDMTSRELADFFTEFTFTLYPKENHSGYGLAFFLAHPNLPFLNNIVEGGGLGLVDGDQVLNLNSTQPYSFVAVEFDTYQNPWDPRGWHIGINFNSMKSNISKSIKLSSHEILVTIGFSCTIEYNSTTHTLTISYRSFQFGKDNQHHALVRPIYFSYEVDLREYLPEHVIVGFTAVTKKLSQEHTLLSWSFRSSLDDSISLIPNNLNHHSIGKKMETEKLGHGGFGDVYKGFLKDLNSEVAIKRISRDSRQGIKEYATEVKIISQLRHKNLVQLIGWCHKKKDLLLVYELMPNGSLDSHLHREKSFLTWEVRYKIALDLASALLYLHEEWDQCVLHRDIKSSNIMLDSSFNAKLGDFGLARLVDRTKGSQTTVIVGTRGYIAPEYFITGKASKETDIYSFGVVLLEIASGRKAIDLKTEEERTIVEWVWDLHGLGKLVEVGDQRLCGAFDDQQMERLVVVAIANPLVFNFRSFKEGDVKLEGDASLLESKIQVTGISRDPNKTYMYSVGRITSNQHMQLWNATSRELTDFWTMFTFAIQPKEKRPTDGLSFFLADPNLPFLNYTKKGSGFGLVDGDQILNSTQHSFVAVEFDTFKDEWDPSGLHVVDLREYLAENVIVGFSVATKKWSPKYVLYSWLLSSNLDSQVPSTSNSTQNQTLPPSTLVTEEAKAKIRSSMGMGVAIGVLVALVSLGFLCFLLWKQNKTEDNEEESLCDLNMDDEFQKGSGPKKFLHDELVIATNKFSNAEKLGHGGFGDVYKGFLKDLNSNVAIKRISRDSKQGIKEYATEVKIISQLRHKNLVQLIGWCHKKKDLLLVYELMPNGGLDSHLHSKRSFLTWEVRDIKSSNIMLDSSFNAKLGDFGLARLVDHTKGSRTTVIVGTRGYIAPEYFITGKASKESDIYSFGVVLLEIASGRKPFELKSEEEMTMVEWVWDLYGLGKLLQVADPKLCGAFDEQEMECLVVAGIWVPTIPGLQIVRGHILPHSQKLHSRNTRPLVSTAVPLYLSCDLVLDGARREDTFLEN